MRRSIHYYWPRAESKIYEEQKKLVAHGLATATREYAGRRPRTFEVATAEGDGSSAPCRSSLGLWQARPSSRRAANSA